MFYCMCFSMLGYLLCRSVKECSKNAIGKSIFNDQCKTTRMFIIIWFYF